MSKIRRPTDLLPSRWSIRGEDTNPGPQDSRKEKILSSRRIGHRMRSKMSAVDEAIYALEGNVEFGAPTNPFDDQSTSLAGATGTGAHNGEIINIKGSWVEVELSSANPAADANRFTCNHNMNIPVAVSGEPNVRWLVFGLEHDGNTDDQASTLSVNFETGDSITTNAIELRLYSGGTRVVDGTHKVKVTLFFIPAVR